MMRELAGRPMTVSRAPRPWSAPLVTRAARVAVSTMHGLTGSGMGDAGVTQAGERMLLSGNHMALS